MCVCVCVCVCVYTPVQLLFAVLQSFLQLGRFLAALLQPLLQSSIFLSKSFTLLSALLQLDGPPGHSLSQLLVLFLLVWREFQKFVLMLRTVYRFNCISLLLIILACV